LLRKSLVLVVSVLLIMSAVALGAEEIVIGLVTPVTGDVATFGMSVRNAALLWEKQVNNRGGIQGRKVKIIVEDDKGTPSESANAVSKLINQSKVLMIMGPVTSKCANAGAPIGQASKVPVLTPTAILFHTVTGQVNRPFRINKASSGVFSNLTFYKITITNQEDMYEQSWNYWCRAKYVRT